ncbi:MAG: transporter [Leeuwenhoekiella sp.]
MSLVFSQEAAEYPALISDRPDMTESADLVFKHDLQIESGVFYEENKNESTHEKVFGYNSTLLRYGLLDNLELRVGLDFQEVQTEINGHNQKDKLSGFLPLILGAKVRVAEESGWFPKIAVLGNLFLPFTAAEDYRPETTGFDFLFAFSNTLSDKSALGYNVGAQWGDDSSEVSYIYSLSYGYSVTENISAFAEVYGSLPEDNAAGHSWDAGLTYLLNNDLQVDATIGSSFNTHQTLLLGAGVSYRLRH